MRGVSRNIVLCLWIISVLCGCGARRRAITQRDSDAKAKIAALEQQVENQKEEIEALEKENAELKKD